VEFPIDSITDGAQNREAKPDRTGHLVAWNEVRATEGTRVSVAKLVRRESDYVLTDQRVVNPAYKLGSGPGGWVHGGRFYEGGEWVDGGRVLKYQATGSALNYDTWTLDLQTGERRKLTNDLDYNETANYSPSSDWVLYSSARGLDRMDVFSQLQRPSFIDMVSFGQIGRISLFNNRRCMNERWIMSRETGQRRGGYAGQPLTLRTDYNIRRVDWFEDGRRFLVTETRLPNRDLPADPEDRYRIAIVAVSGQARQEAPETVNPAKLPYERWTIPADSYTGLPARPQAARVVHGEDSGTATMTFVGNFAGGSWTVNFDRYSDDGRSFVSGSESISYPNALATSTYTADLSVTGAHEGSMRANVQVIYPSSFEGTATSTVDGKTLDGIPTQETCPGISKPELRATVGKEREFAGGRRRLRIDVSAEIAEDRKARPVEHAGIRLRAEDGSRVRTQTNGRGIARALIPAGFPDDYEVVAIAGGFARDAAAAP
jgi:hypothetical protein